jgi:arylsulfatase A-like enzyme
VKKIFHHFLYLKSLGPLRRKRKNLFSFPPPSFLQKNIDKFGTPAAYNHYAVGWAHAMDTPYQWTKQIASHLGGVRNPLVHLLAGPHQGQGRHALAVPSRH